MADAVRRRRILHPRFTLRSALAVSAILCVALAWTSSARRQRHATAALQARGGAVYYDCGLISSWLSTWCPGSLDFVSEPKWVFLGGTSASDEDLKSLRELDSLATINLADTNASDAAIESLSHLASLRLVVLTGTQVTDGGAERLQRALPGCQIRG